MFSWLNIKLSNVCILLYSLCNFKKLLCKQMLCLQFFKLRPRRTQVEVISLIWNVVHFYISCKEWNEQLQPIEYTNIHINLNKKHPSICTNYCQPFNIYLLMYIHTEVLLFFKSAVRAAIEGRILVLEGIEKAERNVLPVLNNLLENREMHLEDGRLLIPASRYDKLMKVIVLYTYIAASSTVLCCRNTLLKI